MMALGAAACLANQDWANRSIKYFGPRSVECAMHCRLRGIVCIYSSATIPPKSTLSAVEQCKTECQIRPQIATPDCEHHHPICPKGSFLKKLVTSWTQESENIIKMPLEVQYTIGLLENILLAIYACWRDLASSII